VEALRKQHEATVERVRTEAGTDALEARRREESRVSHSLREMEIERKAWQKKIVAKLRQESEAALDELRSTLEQRHRREVARLERSWRDRVEEVRSEAEHSLREELAADNRLKAQANEDLRDQLARMETRYEDLKQRFVDMQHGEKSLRVERDELRDELRNLDSQVAQLRGERDSLQDEVTGSFAHELLRSALLAYSWACACACACVRGCMHNLVCHAAPHTARAAPVTLTVGCIIARARSPNGTARKRGNSCRAAAIQSA